MLKTGDLISEFSEYMESDTPDSDYMGNSLDRITEARRILSSCETLQGIPIKNIEHMLSFDKTELMPWEHVSLTLDSESLINIANEATKIFKVFNFVEEIRNNNSNVISMLEELIIPANIIAIGHYALKQFMKLSTLTFEENSLLSVVGVGAFAMCLKLKEVDFSNCEQLSVLNGDIFVGSGVETVRLPDSLEVIHARAFEASNIKNVYAGGIKYTLQEFEKALKDNEYKNFWAVNYLDILNV